MDNNYKVLRQSLGLTQSELASMAGVTRQVVGRTEMFGYLVPPPALSGALAKALVRRGRGSTIAATEEGLLGGYQLGVASVRKLNKRLFYLPKAQWESCMESSGPWINFRREVNKAQYGFCQNLAYDISYLQFWEGEGKCWGQLDSALQEVLNPFRMEELRTACGR